MKLWDDESDYEYQNYKNVKNKLITYRLGDGKKYSKYKG
jgi:hypothetical protein